MRLGSAAGCLPHRACDPRAEFGFGTVVILVHHQPASRLQAVALVWLYGGRNSGASVSSAVKAQMVIDADFQKSARAIINSDEARMIISHKHKFVILAPWKTASSTMWLRFSAYDEKPYSGYFDFNRHLNRVVHQHLTLADFQLLPESRLGYTTAAFVRNPYDRAYSGFIQLQRDIAEQPNEVYPSEWIKELVTDQLADIARRLITTGYDFNRWILKLPEYEVYEAGRNTNMLLHPARYWTHAAGRQIVDFVGRVETFEHDVERLCALIGIPVPEAGNANVTDALPDPGTDKYRYTSRMSREAIDRINHLFADDFTAFGYEMI